MAIKKPAELGTEVYERLRKSRKKAPKTLYLDVDNYKLLKQWCAKHKSSSVSDVIDHLIQYFLEDRGELDRP